MSSYVYPSYADAIRNATRRDHRGSSSSGRMPPSRGRATGATRATPGRTAVAVPVRSVEEEAQQVVVVEEQDDDALRLRKSTLMDLLDIGVDLWAERRPLPAPPVAYGEPKTDFENAGLHRQALAEHEQMNGRVRSTVRGLMKLIEHY